MKRKKRRTYRFEKREIITQLLGKEIAKNLLRKFIIHKQSYNSNNFYHQCFYFNTKTYSVSTSEPYLHQ